MLIATLLFYFLGALLMYFNLTEPGWDWPWYALLGACLLWFVVPVALLWDQVWS